MDDGSGERRGAGVVFRVWLALELVGLYWVIPWFLDLSDRWVGRMLMPALGLVGLVLFFWLVFDRGFRNKSLWNWGAFTRELPRILATAAIAFLIMAGLAWWLDGQSWVPEEVEPFALLKRNWVLLVLISLLYPIFSVYPQEIVLRTWFFHRYKPLLGKAGLMLTVNALTFAWVHVIFQNWVAVLLCVPAGFLFGYTYMKTKSTLASGVEHAIVGNLMWTAGIGWFFFAGAVPDGGMNGVGEGVGAPAAVVAPAEGGARAEGDGG